MTGPTIKIGAPVTGSDFFGRERDVERFWRKINAGQHLLLVSPRRIGKTSLMRHIEANPRDNWVPVFADVEGKTDAAAVIAEIMNRLQNRGGVAARITKRFMEMLETAELRGFGFSAKIKKRAMDDWSQLATAFEEAIAGATTEKDKLLLIIDEFPIVVERLFSNARTRDQAKDLLQLFRKVRTNVKLANRFRMVVGGSIGLKPILRRYNATADANDLKTFRIGPWTKTNALAFMDAIAEAERFEFTPEIRAAILQRTGEQPIPFHLQTMLDYIMDLDKPAAEITVDDVEVVWRDALADVDLDHYRGRLFSVMDEATRDVAEEFLEKVAQDGAQTRKALLSASEDAKIAKAALRVLLEDGYFIERKDSDGERRVRFSNPMIAKFWQRY
ncbi:MAG: hypothetical protein ACR2O4_17205 [Hyphomicrobiaceae bacterium]